MRTQRVIDRRAGIDAIRRGITALRATGDETTRDWLIVSGGSYVRLALGLVVSVALARVLAPESFGVFAVLAAAGAIAGGLADFGLTGAAVRRIAGMTDGTLRLRAWRGFVVLRLAGATAVAGTGILAAGWLCRNVLDIPGRESLLRLALLGVVATALGGTTTAGLQALGRFRSLALVMLANAALSAALAIALVAAGWLTLTTALVVLGIGTSLASAAAGWRLLPEEFRRARPMRDDVRVESRPLLAFGGWLWVASTLGLLAGQLDIVLLGHWSSPAVVGTYALAVALAAKADVLSHSLHAVLLPGAARLRTAGEVRDFLRSGLRRGLLAGLVLAAGLPLAGPAIGLVYGAAYRPSVALFQLLLLVAILDLLTTPALLLAYTVERPRLLALAAALRAGTLAIVAVALIPRYGAEGALAARASASVVVAVAAGGYLMLARGRASESIVEPLEI